MKSIDNPQTPIWSITPSGFPAMLGLRIPDKGQNKRPPSPPLPLSLPLTLLWVPGDEQDAGETRPWALHNAQADSLVPGRRLPGPLAGCQAPASWRWPVFPVCLPNKQERWLRIEATLEDREGGQQVPGQCPLHPRLSQGCCQPPRVNRAQGPLPIGGAGQSWSECRDGGELAHPGARFEIFLTGKGSFFFFIYFY